MSLNPFKQDVFGNNLLIKRIIVFWFGLVAWYRFNIANTTKVEGSRKLKDLPKQRVLFVSNHQTYFADVACMYLVFNCVKWKIYDRIDFIWHLFAPRLNVYFVAATETMKSGILPKMFAYVGSVSIKRTWRAAGKNVDRGVDTKDLDNIRKAIANGWTITFPQGTTTPYVRGRRGTAHLIKEMKPIVIPVVVDGFRRAFDKKGMFLKSKNSELSIRFKDPLDINFDDSPQAIIEQVMESIEQTDDFIPEVLQNNKP
ncbi:MAG: 1-acyl-sn-glycerol-3-phosphate acyltransferase [Schleiferiaceae bacterium]|jgi:1-acyl-sn-glycerol-3-phosphate acyltransferase|nr:1-acyl-sn-glycerol-3-phosphate acyltransferase [Schleiferiaceae bacterium]